VRILGEQLDRLVKDEGHSRLVINFGGVQYLSSAVLGKLAWLAKRVEPVGGRIQLCGLDPLLRDILRITHLDGGFDICSNEAEALGLIVQVRHEVVDVAVLRSRRGRQHLLFCQQYPTGECASINGGVPSPRDNVSSSDRMATGARAEVATASINAV